MVLTDALLTYFVTFPKDKDGFLQGFFYTLYKALPIVSDVVTYILTVIINVRN